MAAYTQGLAYQLDPVTFRNAAFPQLPESTPISTTNVSYDSGEGAAVSSSDSGGLIYNSTFGINPDDYAIYFTLKLTSGGDPETQFVSGAKILSFVNSSGTEVGDTLVATWFSGQSYSWVDNTEHWGMTRIWHMGINPGQCTYHWKGSTPFTNSLGSSLVFDGTPIWDTYYSYLLIYKTYSTNGLQIYVNDTLRILANGLGFSGGSANLTKLKVLYNITNWNNSGNVALTTLNIYSNASEMDYSSMATTTPSPGILPDSYTSGTSKFKKYFINSGAPTPATNVNLSGLEARFDKHRFYYPRPNKMHFTLRGGKNG